MLTFGRFITVIPSENGTFYLGPQNGRKSVLSQLSESQRILVAKLRFSGQNPLMLAKLKKCVPREPTGGVDFWPFYNGDTK